jgi:phage terminase small subunit
MTPKRQKFCDEYLKSGGNVRAAERASGYSMGHGVRILEHDEVKEYVEGHMREAATETQLTIQDVLDSLQHAKEIADMGYATAHGTRIDLGAYLKATELQGKYLGMWIDNLNLSSTGHSTLMDIIKNRSELIE